MNPQQAGQFSISEMIGGFAHDRGTLTIITEASAFDRLVGVSRKSRKARASVNTIAGVSATSAQARPPRRSARTRAAQADVKQ